MSQAKSHVQVTIGGNLDPSFQKSFSAADKKQAEFAQHTGELNKKIGDVGAFRRQQNALKDAASAYTQARQKVATLKAEIEAGGVATRKQAAALAQAERAAARAGGAYTQARTKLADMSRELQRSGVNVSQLSAEYRRLQSELARTNAEQAKHEKSLMRQRAVVNGMRSAWNAIGKTIAGATAAKMVLEGPAKKAVGYDEQIARLAATAGAGKSAAEKERLKTEMSNTIEEARKFSGGAQREDVLTAMNTLVASGRFRDEELPGVLKKVARTSFASGAGADDIAQLAIALKQFGITDLDGAFNRALKAGQVGRFELKNMAKSLPDQLGRATAAGYSGMGGLEEILAMNQVAMNTAGNADQAGNNMVNLLSKMSSREFSDSISKAVKVQKGDPTHAGKKGKGAAFDWAAYAQKNREKGINTIESFAMLLERQLAGNKQYQDLKKRMAGLPDGAEKKETLAAMASIAEGSELGKIMADLQATSAMLARIQGGKQLEEVRSGIKESGGAVEADAAFLGSQVFAKSNMASGALDRANESTFNSLAGPMKSVLDGFNSLTEQFPKLTTAAYAATGALASIAAFVAGSAIFGKLGGAAVAGAAGAAGSGGAGAAAGAAAAGSLLAKGKGLLGRGAMFGRAGAAGLAAWGGLEAAEAMGLPNTDAEKGKQLWDRGEYWKASFYMPAGDFLGAAAKGAWGKMTGEGDKVSEAAKAAAAAAVAAAPQPNVTQTFNNSFAVTVNEAKDGKELVPILQRELDRLNRSQAAAARAGFMGLPQH